MNNGLVDFSRTNNIVYSRKVSNGVTIKIYSNLKNKEFDKYIFTYDVIVRDTLTSNECTKTIRKLNQLEHKLKNDETFIKLEELEKKAYDVYRSSKKNIKQLHEDFNKKEEDTKKYISSFYDDNLDKLKERDSMWK